ncbi:MAG: HNH endonuclease [Candidatus Omnitrophica bacterium]|nr:HNH endonuclease [Candidatus Omnitrophota bacterium]
MTKIVSCLEEKGCISIGDTTRDGTEYIVKFPRDIPTVIEKLATVQLAEKEDDYFTDPAKRKVIFERDKWICQYCGEEVTKDNATLDHYVPQSKGGKHTKENLRTCCLVCNGIKSGKIYEEAAPYILKNIQERRKRKNGKHKK